MKTTKEARQIAADAVLWVSDEHRLTLQEYIDTGIWARRVQGQDFCSAVAQRITEYGEQCAHAAVVEAT